MPTQNQTTASNLDTNTNQKTSSNNKKIIFRISSIVISCILLFIIFNFIKNIFPNLEAEYEKEKYKQAYEEAMETGDLDKLLTATDNFYNYLEENPEAAEKLMEEIEQQYDEFEE